MSRRGKGKILLVAGVFCATGAADGAATRPIVHGMADLHSHVAMHLAFPLAYGKGPLAPLPRRPLRHKHLFRQQMYAPYLKAAGTPLIVTAAYVSQLDFALGRTRQVLVDQLRYVERFAAHDPSSFAVARSPDEARAAIAQGKIALVQAIEGMKGALDDAQDARFWAAQGVALVTPIHIWDDELGGAYLQAGASSFFFNPCGHAKAYLAPGHARALTHKGRAAIGWLADAGVMIDLSHMSAAAFGETLGLARSRGFPPMLTHATLKSVRDEERGLTARDLREVYRLGGLFGLPLSPNIDPYGRDELVAADFCRSSLDAFRLHYEHFRAQMNLSNRVASGEESVAVAMGYGADFNGLVNHLRPKYGRKGCQHESERSRSGLEPGLEPGLEIDTRGLAHPGLLPQLWQRLRDGGADIAPLEASAERFLRAWEQALAVARP